MMTQREFLENVMAMENASDEVVEFATASLAKLDATNEKRRAKNAEKKAEKAPLYDAAIALLTDEFQTTSELAVKMELSVQKTSPILRELVAIGKAEVGDVKVKGKGTQKGYKLVTEA